jgi:hypothetical protein
VLGDLIGATLSARKGANYMLAWCCELPGLEWDADAARDKSEDHDDKT